MHHIGLGMQFFPARLTGIENSGKTELKAGETGIVTFKVEKKIVFEEGERAIVLKPEGTGLRVAGCGAVIL